MHLKLLAPTKLTLSELETPGLRVHGDAGGEGFGPLQMFAASLALCTAAALASYADNVLSVSIASLRIELSWSYAERPYRVDGIEMEIVWPELPDSRLRAAERAAKSCTIHHTLEQPPHIATRVQKQRGSGSS